MHVEWNDAFSIGISEIDDQHKKFFELLDKSYSLIFQGNSQSALSQLLDELIAYSKYHFAEEEELMRKHNYVNLDQHILKHSNFTNKILSYKIEIIREHKYMSVDIFDFIRNWLLDHILETDIEMGKNIHFKQNH
jgi:hemerythrin-like metal-binding protein